MKNRRIALAKRLRERAKLLHFFNDKNLLLYETKKLINWIRTQEEFSIGLQTLSKSESTYSINENQLSKAISTGSQDLIKKIWNLVKNNSDKKFVFIIRRELDHINKTSKKIEPTFFIKRLLEYIENKIGDADESVLFGKEIQRLEQLSSQLYILKQEFVLRADDYLLAWKNFIKIETSEEFSGDLFDLICSKTNKEWLFKIFFDLADFLINFDSYREKIIERKIKSYWDDNIRFDGEMLYLSDFGFITFDSRKNPNKTDGKNISLDIAHDIVLSRQQGVSYKELREKYGYKSNVISAVINRINKMIANQIGLLRAINSDIEVADIFIEKFGPRGKTAARLMIIPIEKYIDNPQYRDTDEQVVRDETPI